MRRVAIAVVIIVITGLLGYLYARNPRTPTPPPSPTSTRPPEGRVASDGAVVAKGCDDLAHSIRAALSRGGAIPDGTRLVSISLDGAECVIELSSEFAAVANQGTTGESEAQNALRAALAAFDRVKTLRVLVDGAVFEGSHSGEWEGIPVRDSMPTTDGGE
ncbi:MAG: GerMN domain-containing protein [Chthonomonadales bacterium]|nr:GerMN domain-containing protein [Chthonomonadales bacterium]